jgi:dihydrofolate synthase/folylpolyglutamate synthase
VSFEDVYSAICAFVANTGIFIKGDQKLQRMQDLMNCLGNPQNKLKVVHVAGTSGKTSTSYFVAAFLQRAGQGVGLTISPHVVDVRERAQINLAILEEDVYVREVAEYLDLVKAGKQHPSYMEFFMGFFYYLAAKMQLDYVVVETGLGGLYDASNVVRRRDKVCLITDIGHDHTEILGDTLTEIAWQKAGIIGADNPVFMHEQSPEVMRSILDVADAQNAPVQIVPEKDFAGLPGFQAHNAGLALAAVEFVLGRDGEEPLTPTQIAEAAKVAIPARAEEFVYKGKRVVIDGAHNPQKLAVFGEHIMKKYGDKKIVLVAAFGSNKVASLDGNLECLSQMTKSIVLTTFEDSSVETAFRQSLAPEIVKTSAKKHGFSDIKIVKDPKKALQEAAKTNGEVVVVTGSFLLLNHIRPVLLGGLDVR